MTDDVRDDPILDDRIRRALTELADSHTPTAAAWTDGRRSSRRLLASAAIVIVLAGVGALVVAAQRDVTDRPVSTQTPAPAPAPVDSASHPPTTGPPTTAASASASSIPTADAFRFDAPLPDSMVAVLDPAPFAFVETFRVEQPDLEFLTGRGTSVQILVLDDGVPVAMVSVSDLDVPLDTIDPGQTLAISDGTTLSYAGVGVETFFVVAGSSIRELSVPNRRSTDGEFSTFDERLALATEVAAHIEAQPLDDLDRTDRFAPQPAPSRAPTVATYAETAVQGEGGTVEVGLVTTRESIDAAEFRLIANGFGQILDEPAPNAAIVEMTQSPQLQYVEQISATQFVVISAGIDIDRTALDTFAEALTFVDAAAADIDVEVLGGAIAPVLARGDDRWGRWELYERTGADGCYGFGATVWGDATNTQQSSNAPCSPAGVTPEFVCLRMDSGELAGLYVGDGVLEVDPSIALAIIGEPGDPIVGVGTPNPFLIDPIDVTEPVSVLIDGVPVALPCR